MGKSDILREIESLKQQINEINEKVDIILKRQKEIDKKVQTLSDIEDILDTLPAKLNTASFQIISNFEDSTKNVSKKLEDSIDKSLSKLNKLADIDKRLDAFEEDLRAYISKMRFMLLELEDSLRR
ncbi:hypothetical protein [Candidatus Aciduliprofundum boonei]|uniref:Uncharacterized protein n=1 Tax=Aciduliprofundum boonei (strain DSM 19572 / T469) TaxID=439481 RepID=D3T9K3_ACIB4|nr:hypothetical protein [Candidatus Aciduliprofundum boonei]ADD08782.1 hypothetical protein Aboo_0973 [Aciduliprofundum boonei T469]